MQFQLYKSANDQNWYWRFFTNNQEIFPSSEGYVNKADAVRSMDIASGSSGSERLEQRSDGKWYRM
jgi:uncharacterized protein YegP (UPF0339 family)